MTELETPFYARTSTYVKGAAGLFALVTVLNSFTIIDSGTVGVVRRLGAIQDTALSEGPHFKLPFFDSVSKEDIRTVAIEVPIAAASKDLQDVTTKVTVTWSLIGEKAPNANRLIGSRKAIQAAILDNGIPQSAKSVISGFTVENLVTQRETVRQKVDEQLRSFIATSLAQRRLEGYVQLNSVAITDFGFSKKFAAAIEAKSTADQERLQAIIEKQKKITEAEAIAESTKAEASAKAFKVKVESEEEAAAINRVKSALGGASYTEYLKAKALQDNWNGAFPQVVGGNSIVTLEQLTGAALKGKQ
jgi:regulator of protease activity HflC (stomatin/prohibitin superfamily)